MKNEDGNKGDEMNNEEQKVMENMVMIKLRISAWLGGTRMKKAEETVQEKHGAEAGTVDVRVRQIAKKYEAPIQHGMNVLRQYWYEHSLPWEDGGWRVVSSSAYMDLLKEMGDMIKEQWEKPVEILLKNYDDVRSDAKRRLGDLFDEERFPEKSLLRSKYDIDISTRAIQMPQDMRVAGFSESQMNELKKEVEGEYREQIQGTVCEVIGRMSVVMSDVIARMDKDPKGTKYKGLWSQMERMVKVLPKLNFTDDKHIAELITKIREEIQSVSVLDLRESADVRKQVKRKAKCVLKQLDAFGL